MIESLSDIDLIKNVRNSQCSASLIELRKRHEGIVNQMINRYSGAVSNCSGLSCEDLLQERDMIVYQAALDFQEDKNVKFVTWLGNKTRYFCLNSLKSEGKYFTSEPEVITHIIDSTYTYEGIDTQKVCESSEYILNLADNLKDKRIKRIVKQRYFSDKRKDRSFKSIAKKLGMSAQGVINLHDNFISFVQKKLKSTNNMDVL